MVRTLSEHHSSRCLPTRNSNVSDQTRQRGNQYSVPSKRSVSSLSAKQLERKRANDREAQRLIRQRTKDRIEWLETQIVDLRMENERLNRSLKQGISNETDIFHKGGNVETGSGSWTCSKITNLPRGRELPSQGHTSPCCSSTHHAVR